MISFINNFRKDKVLEAIEKDTTNIIHASNKLKMIKKLLLK